MGKSEEIFMRRRSTLKRKARELASLCNVDVCMVCYGPNDQVELWPEDPAKAQSIIARYNEANRKPNCKKREKLNLSDVLNKKMKQLGKKVLIDHHININNEYSQFNINNYDMRMKTWDEQLKLLSHNSLMNLSECLETKIWNLDEKVESLKVEESSKQLNSVMPYNQFQFGSSSLGQHYKMECEVLRLTCAPPVWSPAAPSTVVRLLPLSFCSSPLKLNHPSRAVLWRSFSEDEPLLEGLPKEYYDDEWQARQREKTKELHQRRREEEERKIEEYREIGMRLKGYPEEDIIKARKLISSFIRSAEEVEERIEEAAKKGELTELVLMVIWNRLDLARRDDEKDAIRSLDLLYRRVETEILKREATPAMRLLNDLLNLHDGFDDEVWLKECKNRMIDTFPREDPFSILVPAGFDIDKHQGPLRPPLEADDALLRVDFVREVDALLQEVKSEQSRAPTAQGLDPESVASQLKQQEKQRTICQVEALLDLAANLIW